MKSQAEQLQQAFVAGAAWWEYHQTSATMWQSDRAIALEEAERRYPDDRSLEGDKR